MTDAAQPNATPTQPENTADRAGGNQADPPALFTQGDLDFHIAKEKAEIRRRLQEQYGDLDELAKAKAELDAKRAAEMSEMEKLQKALADKDAEIAAAKAQADTERLNALRLRVGQEIGLPPVLAARLQGADEAELKADAEAVRAVLGQPAQPPTIPNMNAASGMGQTGGGRTAVKLTPEQRAIADQYNISYEDYAKSLQQFEE